MSRGNDRSLPRFSFPLLRGPAIQHRGQRVQAVTHNALEPGGKKGKNLNMQSGSFKMVRLELRECTPRQSCSQDGRGDEREERGPENRDPLLMCGTINLCCPFFCSKAPKLKVFILQNYGCQFADCAARRKGVLLLGEERLSRLSLATRIREMGQ